MRFERPQWHLWILLFFTVVIIIKTAVVIYNKQRLNDTYDNTVIIEMGENYSGESGRQA